MISRTSTKVFVPTYLGGQSAEEHFKDQKKKRDQTIYWRRKAFLEVGSFYFIIFFQI